MRFEDFLALIEDYRWRIKTAGISRSAWRQGTKTNRALLKALAEAKVPIRVVRRGDRFDWGGPDRRILHPAPATSAAPTRARPANASIVYLLRMNGIDALFTGDIERPVAENVATLLDPALDDPVDNFLATHHGSKEGSIEELLDVIRPRWAGRFSPPAATATSTPRSRRSSA